MRPGMADIVRTLNDLIATCRDSQEGFQKARAVTMTPSATA